MKFSLPYNNSDPEEFLSLFLPYKEEIVSFYFELPGVFIAHNNTPKEALNTVVGLANTYKFLDLVKGKFQTVLCLNTLVYPQDYESTRFKVFRELTPLVENFGLTAVNVASPTLAEIIHEFFPTLDIQTSCNTFTFITNMYRLWNEKFDTTVFNLPREALRTPWLLDQFKETGFVSKCLVNEGCIYGCPGNIEHACENTFGCGACRVFCSRDDYHLSDIFKSNFIPPHRLGEFEDRIDIAKIAGRKFPTQKIHQIFLAYLNRDPNVEISDVFHGRVKKYLADNGIHIKAKDWPKKTLTCECKECKICNICFKAMEHAIKRQGLDPSKLTRKI